MPLPYTVLRIFGATNELERLLPVLLERVPELSPKLTRHGDVVMSLTTDSDSDDWGAAVERLKRLEWALLAARAAGCEALADADFQLHELPENPQGAALRRDAIQLPAALLAALGQLAVSFRVTVYRLYPDKEA